MISKLLLLPLALSLSTSGVGSISPLSYSSDLYSIDNGSSIVVGSSSGLSSENSLIDLITWGVNTSVSVSYDSVVYRSFVFDRDHSDISNGYYLFYNSIDNSNGLYLLVLNLYTSLSSSGCVDQSTRISDLSTSLIVYDSSYYFGAIGLFYGSSGLYSGVVNNSSTIVSSNLNFSNNPISILLETPPYNSSIPFENTFLYFLKTYITPVFGDFSSYYIVVGGNLIYPFDFLYYLSISLFILWLFVYVPYFFLRKLIKGGKKK